MQQQQHRLNQPLPPQQQGGQQQPPQQQQAMGQPRFPGGAGLPSAASGQQQSGMMGLHPQDGGMGSYGVQRSISAPHDPQMMLNRPVTGSGAAFSMSDFPALAQNRSVGGPAMPGDLSGPGSYAMHIGQQRQQSDFAIQSEDFPALGGAGGATSSPSSGPRQVMDDANGRGQQHFFQQQQQQQHRQPAPPGSPGAFAGQAFVDGASTGAGGAAAFAGRAGKPPQSPIAQQQQQQMLQQQQQAKRQNGAPPGVLGGFDSLAGNGGFGGAAAAASTAAAAAASAGAQPPDLASMQPPVKKAPGAGKTRLPADEEYGLKGLLSVIRMEDADRGTLALGTDLTTLGLNLNSSESLHTSFASPWSDRPSTRDPPYQLPQCYNNGTDGAGAPMRLPLKPAHFPKFHLETLFYIFYAMPRDVAQVLAAQELYNRGWRYHTEHRVWFSDSSKELAQQHVHQLPPDTPRFIYFDIQTWERRLFTNAALARTLQSGFMQSSAVFALATAPPQQPQQSQQPQQ